MRAIASWCAAWLVVWGIAASFAPRTPAIPVSALNNAIAAERLYADGITGRTVTIGSSLIGQLPINRFDPRAVNLGLSAYGAATGILLVERSGQLPRVAVIETNELYAPPESAYVDSLADAARHGLAELRATRFEFRPSTQAIGAVVRWSRYLRRLQPEAGKRRTAQRAADDLASDRADTVGVRASVRWVAEQLREWRRRGVRVVLLPVPVHPTLEAAESTRSDRAIVEAELPPSEFEWLSLGDRGWRTSDGRHLERGDAMLAARTLLAALARP